MARNWHQWTAGILSGFAMVVFLAACEQKQDQSSQAPVDQSKSLAGGQPEKREAPIAPAPEVEQRSGAGKQEKQPGAAG